MSTSSWARLFIDICEQRKTHPLFKPELHLPLPTENIHFDEIQCRGDERLGQQFAADTIISHKLSMLVNQSVGNLLGFSFDNHFKSNELFSIQRSSTESKTPFLIGIGNVTERVIHSQGPTLPTSTLNHEKQDAKVTDPLNDHNNTNAVPHIPPSSPCAIASHEKPAIIKLARPPALMNPSYHDLDTNSVFDYSDNFPPSPYPSIPPNSHHDTTITTSTTTKEKSSHISSPPDTDPALVYVMEKEGDLFAEFLPPPAQSLAPPVPEQTFREVEWDLPVYLAVGGQKVFDSVLTATHDNPGGDISQLLDALQLIESNIGNTECGKVVSAFSSAAQNLPLSMFNSLISFCATNLLYLSISDPNVASLRTFAPYEAPFCFVKANDQHIIQTHDVPISKHSLEQISSIDSLPPSVHAKIIETSKVYLSHLANNESGSRSLSNVQICIKLCPRIVLTGIGFGGSVADIAANVIAANFPNASANFGAPVVRLHKFGAPLTGDSRYATVSQTRFLTNVGETIRKTAVDGQTEPLLSTSHSFFHENDPLPQLFFLLVHLTKGKDTTPPELLLRLFDYVYYSSFEELLVPYGGQKPIIRTRFPPFGHLYNNVDSDVTMKTDLVNLASQIIEAFGKTNDLTSMSLTPYGRFWSLQEPPPGINRFTTPVTNVKEALSSFSQTGTSVYLSHLFDCIPFKYRSLRSLHQLLYREDSFHQLSTAAKIRWGVDSLFPSTLSPTPIISHWGVPQPQLTLSDHEKIDIRLHTKQLVPTTPPWCHIAQLSKKDNTTTPKYRLVFSLRGSHLFNIIKGSIKVYIGLTPFKSTEIYISDNVLTMTLDDIPNNLIHDDRAGSLSAQTKVSFHSVIATIDDCTDHDPKAQLLFAPRQLNGDDTYFVTKKSSDAVEFISSKATRIEELSTTTLLARCFALSLLQPREFDTHILSDNSPTCQRSVKQSGFNPGHVFLYDQLAALLAEFDKLKLESEVISQITKRYQDLNLIPSLFASLFEGSEILASLFSHDQGIIDCTTLAGAGATAMARAGRDRNHAEKKIINFSQNSWQQFQPARLHALDPINSPEEAPDAFIDSLIKIGPVVHSHHKQVAAMSVGDQQHGRKLAWGVLSSLALVAGALGIAAATLLPILLIPAIAVGAVVIVAGITVEATLKSSYNIYAEDCADQQTYRDKVTELSSSLHTLQQLGESAENKASRTQSKLDKTPFQPKRFYQRSKDEFTAECNTLSLYVRESNCVQQLRDCKMDFDKKSSNMGSSNMVVLATDCTRNAESLALQELSKIHSTFKFPRSINASVFINALYRVHLLHKMRSLLRNSFIYGIHGDVSAGKSQLVTSLGFQTLSSSDYNTPVPSLFQFPSAPSLALIDFPGRGHSNRAHTEISDLLIPLADANIILTEHTSFLNELTVDLVKHLLNRPENNQQPILVLMNKADIFLVPESTSNQRSGNSADLLMVQDDSSDEDDDDVDHGLRENQIRLKSKSRIHHRISQFLSHLRQSLEKDFVNQLIPDHIQNVLNDASLYNDHWYSEHPMPINASIFPTVKVQPKSTRRVKTQPNSIGKEITKVYEDVNLRFPRLIVAPAILGHTIAMEPGGGLSCDIVGYDFRSRNREEEFVRLCNDYHIFSSQLVRTYIWHATRLDGIKLDSIEARDFETKKKLNHPKTLAFFCDRGLPEPKQLNDQ